jgi:Spy/CpxP family protein refolding chaperone
MDQLNAVNQDSSLSTDQKRAKAQQIKQTAFPKIQAVLTPEQQKKLSEMQQRARQQQGQTDGPTSQQPPQK